MAPRSPDLTPCDSLVWEDVKDSVFETPLPVDLLELRARMINAFQEVNRDILRRVWDELDYRFDICRITRGEQYGEPVP